MAGHFGRPQRMWIGGFERSLVLRARHHDIASSPNSVTSKMSGAADAPLRQREVFASIKDSVELTIPDGAARFTASFAKVRASLAPR